MSGGSQLFDHIVYRKVCTSQKGIFHCSALKVIRELVHLYVGMVPTRSKLTKAIFSAVMISMTCMVAQKPHGGQLNIKVCSNKNTIIVILSSFDHLFKQR